MNQLDSVRWELTRALAQKGCAICRISQKAVSHFLDAVLYESVNDPDIRREASSALGFCNRHAWQMREMGGNALGTAFLQRTGLGQWQKQLEGLPNPEGLRFEKYREQTALANEATGTCLGCKKQAELERRYMEGLLKSITDPDFAGLIRTSAGLCRKHFAQACDTSPDSETLSKLVEIETGINRRLLGELDEFIRKSNYQFRGEGFGSEGDSWLRAIECLAGAEDAVC